MYDALGNTTQQTLQSDLTFVMMCVQSKEACKIAYDFLIFEYIAVATVLSIVTVSALLFYLVYRVYSWKK